MRVISCGLKRAPLVVALTCVFGMPVGMAQDMAAADGEGLVSEDIYFEDIPMVMTATRLKQTRTQTPVSVTVIDRTQIEASGFTEIVDLLRLVPGFQVAHAGSRIFTATYHGQADDFPNRLQVLVDGRSVYLPLLSSVDWSMLGVQMDDIERIEVIRGPNSPAYGANAFLGTVNIITREPVSEVGEFVGIRAGDPGMRNVSLRHAGGMGDLDYRVSLGYRQNSGYEDIYDDVEVSEINFRGSYYASVEDEIDLHLGAESGQNGVTGAGDAFTPDHDRDSRASFQKVRWRHVLSSSSDVNVQFYHNYYYQNDEYQVGQLSDIFTSLYGSAFTVGLGGSVPDALKYLGLTEEDDQMINFSIYDGTAQRYDLEAQHLMLFEGGHQLVWGAGMRLDTLESEYYLGHSDTEKDTSQRVFFNGQYVLTDAWTANAGLMVEEGDIVDTQYSPRIALNWGFAEGHVVRVSTTEAHRNPSLLDANWDMAARTAGGQALQQRKITPGKLKSEHIRSYELGYAGEFPRQSTFVELKVFREEIRDAVNKQHDPVKMYWDTPIGSEALVIVNEGYSNVDGVEGQISYKPSKKSFVNFQFSIADADAEKHKAVNSTGPRDVSVATPERTMSVLAGYGFPKDLDVSTGVYHISSMEWLGDGDVLPEYTRVDARVAKGFTLAGQESQVALVVQNIGNSYKDFYAQNEFKTRSYLQFTMNIQ